MFLFSPTFLALVFLAAAALLLLAGLVRLTRQRHDELLLDYLLPDIPNAEEEFFQMPLPEEGPPEEETEPADEEGGDEAQWPELPPEMRTGAGGTP